MKVKAIFLISCVMMSIGHVYGQWSVKAGSSFAKFTGDGATMGVGAFAGGFYDWKIWGENVYLRSGLVYQFDQADAQYPSGGQKRSFRMHYLKVPLQLSYHIKLNEQNYINPYLGGYMYFGLFGQYDDYFGFGSKVSNIDAYNALDRFNYGLTGGVEYEFRKHYLISAEYNIGLNDVKNYDLPSVLPDALKTLNSICIGLGYKF